MKHFVRGVAVFAAVTVTANAAGTAKITVKTGDGGKTAARAR